MPVTCYSQRILNPFRGVMNIISTGGGDAVTIDGINWTVQLGGTSDNLRAIDFYNRNIGWIAGDNGILLRTENGGETWMAESSGLTTSFFGLDMSDANHLWVVGDGGRIIRIDRIAIVQ